MTARGVDIPLGAQRCRPCVVATENPGEPRVDGALLVIDDGHLTLVNGLAAGGEVAGVRHVSRLSGGATFDTFEIDFAALGHQVERILILATATGGALGQLSELGLLIGDPDTREQLVIFVDAEVTIETTSVLGELHRQGDGWNVRTIGAGAESTQLARLAPTRLEHAERPAAPPPEPAWEFEPGTVPPRIRGRAACLYDTGIDAFDGWYVIGSRENPYPDDLAFVDGPALYGSGGVAVVRPISHEEDEEQVWLTVYLLDTTPTEEEVTEIAASHGHLTEIGRATVVSDDGLSVWLSEGVFLTELTPEPGRYSIIGLAGRPTDSRRRPHERNLILAYTG